MADFGITDPVEATFERINPPITSVTNFDSSGKKSTYFVLKSEFDKIAATLLCSPAALNYYRVHRPWKYYEIAFHPLMIKRKVRQYFMQYHKTLNFMR